MACETRTHEQPRTHKNLLSRDCCSFSYLSSFMMGLVDGPGAVHVVRVQPHPVGYRLDGLLSHGEGRRFLLCRDIF